MIHCLLCTLADDPLRVSRMLLVTRTVCIELIKRKESAEGAGRLGLFQCNPSSVQSFSNSNCSLWAFPDNPLRVLLMLLITVVIEISIVFIRTISW